MEIPFGGYRVTSASLVIWVFLSKAANLTAVLEEKEQTLQEKTEVILQKEQEIFQLKKGEESAPAEPSDLLPPGTPAWKWRGVTGLTVPPSAWPRSRLGPVANAPAAE